MPERRFRALRALLVVAFVSVAAWRIGAPGLHYDETLFVNAALGGIDDVFVYRRLFGVPVMTMGYIGALKSWLHAPVFALLGVSPGTIRLPSVLICGAALLLYGRLAETLFGRGLGLLFFAVLATDPALFCMSRFDYGPFVLMVFLKAAALLIFFAWLRQPTAPRLWALLLSMALGIFDKLNFIWFAIALGVGSIAIYPGAVWAALQRSGLWGWLAVGVAAAAAAAVVVSAAVPLLRGYQAPVVANGRLSLERVESIAQLTSGSLEGGSLWGMLFRGDSPHRAITSLGAAAAAIAALPLLAVGATPIRHPAFGSAARLACFFAALFAVVFAEMIATPQTSGAHHAMMLFPLHLFALFSVAAFAIDRARRHRRLVGAIVAATAAILVASQVLWIAAYLRRIEENGPFRPWSDPAIYDLAALLHEQSPATVVSADWGLHTQLFALAPPSERPRYFDSWQVLNAQGGSALEQRERLRESDFSGRNAIVVLHAPDVTFMKDARAAFLELERDSLQQTAPTRTVYNAAGEPIYELHFVTAR
jgi:4-amino-4-deoxy-L-arabinose transferase-like glycosyltransferase